MVGKTYGFYLQRGMGYGLLRTYGLWYAIPCEPSWWTAQAMGYKGLWVIRGMGYEGFNCSAKFNRLTSRQRASAIQLIVSNPWEDLLESGACHFQVLTIWSMVQNFDCNSQSLFVIESILGPNIRI